MQRPPSRSPWDATMLTCRQGRPVTAAQPPWPAWALEQRSDALLPQFVAWYVRLRALPRRMRRALQRKLSLSLAGVALLLALGQGPLQAATITVDGATCTLVDAITAANTDAAQGGCPAGSGADSLVLEPLGGDVILTQVHNSTYGPAGLPVVSTPITIVGNGSRIRRPSNAPAFRLLAVNTSGNLTLREVTLTGGLASGSFPASDGGGVLNYNGTVTVEGCTIAGNLALGSGGGLANVAQDLGAKDEDASVTLLRSTITGNAAGGDGGGLSNAGLTDGRAAVSLTQSTISGNIALSSVGGGGLSNRTYYGVAHVTLSQSTISGNAAFSGRGGGIHTAMYRHGYDATVILTQSTVSGNTADRGGGVYNYFGILRLTKSTVSGNTATDRGGGVYGFFNSGVTLTRSTISGNTARDGGGVFGRYYLFLTLTESTISGNTATNSGGGVYSIEFGESTLTQSTITGNTATVSGGGILNADSFQFNLTRSLVAGNVAPTAPEIENRNSVVRANAFNLFGFDGNAGVTGFTPGPTDLVPDEPLSAILDPVLADNGGATETHALVPGSPAVDAIPATDPACTGPDQRGVPRPQGDGCDIGAVEFGGAAGAFGATVTGLQPQTVWCRNETTGQVVTFEPGEATSWDCAAAGLMLQPGDRVATRARGPATGPGEVSGAVTGLQPSKAGCTNLTTGQHVEQALFGDTTWNCQAMGLVAAPGERVQTSVRGRAGSEDHRTSGAQAPQ